jgi:hypothetical protein
MVEGCTDAPIMVMCTKESTSKIKDTVEEYCGLVMERCTKGSGVTARDMVEESIGRRMEG